MRHYRISLTFFGLICVAGCTTPDLSAEVESFSTSVQEVSAEYHAALAIGADTDRNGQIAALVADRRSVLQVSEACYDRQADASDCVIDETGLTLQEGSVARAARQLDMMSDYFAALNLLVTSKGPTDIQNAAALALDSVVSVSGTLTGGSAGQFAQDLAARRTGITQVAGFLAEQARYSKLRQIVARADPAIERLVLALIDTSVGQGKSDIIPAQDRLDESEVAMIAAKNSGSDADYAAAIRTFLNAHEELVKQKQTGLVQRLRLIRETHAALLNRLSGSPSPEEVVALIERLKTLHSGLKGGAT